MLKNTFIFFLCFQTSANTCKHKTVDPVGRSPHSDTAKPEHFLCQTQKNPLRYRATPPPLLPPPPPRSRYFNPVLFPLPSTVPLLPLRYSSGNTGPKPVQETNKPKKGLARRSRILLLAHLHPPPLPLHPFIHIHYSRIQNHSVKSELI